jgi:fatty-acid desaturase
VREMKTYNVIGYFLILLQFFASGLAAPPDWSFIAGSFTGLFYLLLAWFFGGIYISNILHMGIAHKSLAFKGWFVKLMTVLYNTFGIYVNPVTWVNRHRHHHAFADHQNDPNKRADDGFWKTMYLCFFPYSCKSNLAQDRILKTRSFRFVSNPYFAVFSQFSSYGLIWFAFRDLVYALVLWCGVRFTALWVTMIQNYWTHDRRFGTRRYQEDEDNAMNLGEWLPVTASFSASLQNNHHHFPNFMRTSHHDSEYDFGLLTVRAMKGLGLVKATPSGAQIPEGIPLSEAGF